MRYHRCQYCDKPGQKSIDMKKDEVIKTTKGYYHLDCYKNYLSLKKKMSPNEIEINVKELQQSMDAEIQEEKDRDNLTEWLENFYNANIPTYIFMKINDAVHGKNKLIKDEVNYNMLLEIYEKMGNYLNKVAVKKHFSRIEQRMNYDLAVVLNNINEYKRYKVRQETTEKEDKEIDELIKATNVTKSINTNKNDNKLKDFNIADSMQDLLL